MSDNAPETSMEGQTKGGKTLYITRVDVEASFRKFLEQCFEPSNLTEREILQIQNTFLCGAQFGFDCLYGISTDTAKSEDEACEGVAVLRDDLTKAFFEANSNLANLNASSPSSN